MLRSYVPFGAFVSGVAICLAITGCAAPHDDESAAGLVQPPPEVEEDLALNVDALDVRHGTLRIEASMVDGSADVGMFLGPECDDREVGHGIATPSGFAWSLSGSEIARAIECNLVVHVHAIDEDGRRVRRSATLPVSVGLVDDNTENVKLLRQEPSGAATKMIFTAPSRAQRLHIAGSVIGAESDDEEAPEAPKSLSKGPAVPAVAAKVFVSSFMIDNDDLARAVVGRKHLTILGEDFLSVVSVGSMTLDVSEPVPETTPVVNIAPIVKQREPEPPSEREDWGYYNYEWDGDYGDG